MEKSRNKAIKVAKDISPALSSRDVAQKLRPLIEKADTPSVDLDFMDVQFISRSVAHELLVLKESLASKKQIVFTNLSSDVKEMLRVTAANRVAPIQEEPQFNPRRTSIKELMSEPALV